MRDRLGNNDMTVERASAILADIVEQRKRWGKNYDAGNYRTDELLDALVVLSESATTESEAMVALKHAELVKARRELGAAKARYKRLEKRVQGQQESVPFVGGEDITLPGSVPSDDRST